MKMEGESRSIATVWVSVAASLSYCYIIGRVIPIGITRLVLILPVVLVFFLLPLKLTLASVSGTMGFLIAFLGNLKLLLFAFGKGPLVAAQASILHFVAIGCLPIKVVVDHGIIKSSNDDDKKKQRRRQLLNYVVKGVLLAAAVKAYDYSDQIHPKLMLLLYCLIIYFLLEILLVTMGAFARAAFGLVLEPQFNQPHLSTSLQDFWGHRWNLVVTAILHPAVYEPVCNLSRRVMVRRLSPLPAILATFLVSGLMHEAIFYYMTLKRDHWPTLSVTGFFLFQGVCLAIEVVIKKCVAERWQLPMLVSRILTITFVATTGMWWFIPELVKIDADKRGLEEFKAVGKFMMVTIQSFLLPFLHRR